MATIRFGSVSLDCDDPEALGEFWSAVLDGEVAFASDAFVAVKFDRGWISAVKVDGYVAPTWPDDDRPKQMHLDLSVDDLDEAEAEVVRRGATRALTQPSPDRWRVLLDPAGHPFCITTQIPD
jgi:Glyoxalase-like domain